MSIATRRKFGISLIAISTVSFLVLFGVGLLRSDWHFDGGGATALGSYADYTVDLGVSEFYFIPIVLCGLAGAFCWLWPVRKPPKLNQ